MREGVRERGRLVAGLNADAALCATSAAFALGLAGTRLLHPLRSPRARLALYLEAPRAHLGGSPVAGFGAVFARDAMWRVLGPLAGSVTRFFERLVRVGPQEQLERSLRRAGVNMTVDDYRAQYLRWAVGAPVAFGAAGVLTGKALYVAIFFVLGIYAGARRMPERLKACTRRRSERVRSDLPAIAGVLALKIDNNKSLAVSVADVVEQGSGPVVDDLARAAHLVNAGYGEAAAFELVASESAEPAAARFYRFLSAASSGGLDLAGALLDQANELRSQRREEVERSAARRQMSLVLPNLVFMAPVMFVFLLAPLPQMLFGK